MRIIDRNLRPLSIVLEIRKLIVKPGGKNRLWNVVKNGWKALEHSKKVVFWTTLSLLNHIAYNIV